MNNSYFKHIFSGLESPGSSGVMLMEAAMSAHTVTADKPWLRPVDSIRRDRRAQQPVCEQ